MIVSCKKTGCSLDKSPGDKWNFLACLFFISFMHLFIHALLCSLNTQSVRSRFLGAKPRPALSCALHSHFLPDLTASSQRRHYCYPEAGNRGTQALDFFFPDLAQNHTASTSL